MNNKDEPNTAAGAETENDTEISVATNRRSFLAALLGIGAAGVGAALAVPVARFSMHPLMAQTIDTGWTEIGAIDEFAALTAPVQRMVKIERLDGWRKNVSEKSVYIVNDANTGQPRILSTVCPHLGCTVAWNEEKKQFVSPCHNGVFAPDGSLVSGPPRRSMDELETKIENDRLFIRYQYFRPLVETKEVVG